MRNNNLFLCLFLLIATRGLAQSPSDGLMMPQGQLCVLGQYSNSKWENYWQGTLKRSNSNLGSVTTQSAMLMANYGISKKLNVMAGLPFVWTQSSASYLAGQKGIQDFAVFLKYQALDKSALNGKIKLQGTGGLSTPASQYTGDFLPLGIGLHSKTASIRAIFNYTANMGLYLTAQAGHTWRSSIKLDRDAYIYDNELIYSDKMPVPNLLDYSVRIGFIKPRFQTEVVYDAFTGLNGDDIRYNEAPQASNKMAAGQISWFGKVFITKQFGVLATIGKVLNGRNVGESLNWSLGGTYFFDVNIKKTEPAK